MERRILGKETVTLLDGTEKEITIYSFGFYEKLQLVKRCTKTEYIKGYSYKTVDEIGVMTDILRTVIDGATIEELDYNAQEIYDKYFKPSEEKTKKDNTSTTSHTDTQ